MTSKTWFVTGASRGFGLGRRARRHELTWSHPPHAVVTDYVVLAHEQGYAECHGDSR
jgi:NAD(P)-dependent dehydrogenase (short-subunit alcohol dehydrogenase family)